MHYSVVANSFAVMLIGEWLVKEEKKKVTGHIDIPEFSFGELDDLEVQITTTVLYSACTIYNQLLGIGCLKQSLLISGRSEVHRYPRMGRQVADLQGCEIVPFAYKGEAAGVRARAER